MHQAPASDDHLIPDPILERDGILQLRLADRIQPLLVGGGTIAGFLPGWRARALYTGFAPLFLLELEHEAGGRATWFLTHRMERAADSLHQLSPDLRALLRQRCLLVLGRLTGAVLDRCDPVLDPAATAFLEVCLHTRHEIATWCLEALIPEACLYLAADLQPHSLLFRNAAGALTAIDRDRLQDGLDGDWQARLAGFLRSGRMTWPSPVDGAALHAQGGLFVDDFHFAYRFADHRHGLVFFVLVGDHHSVLAGLWFPSLGLVVSPDEARKGLAYTMLRHLPWWVLSHLLVHARALVPALRRGAAGFASVMRAQGLHIGHQLWNELTGIQHALDTHPDALPCWIVPDAAGGTELFGRIDALFPELAGRVVRSLGAVEAVIDHAYRSDLFLVRVTSDRVTASLRSRIQALALRSEAGRQAGAAARRAVRRSAPVVLFGLRVENRTAVEMKPFLDRLVRAVASRHPGAVIVFDGHNASPDDAPDNRRIIRSHGEREGAARPVEVERGLVAAVRDDARMLDVTIADTIGQPVASSIGWCLAADCFVSIWGAGLAKYRWVCNRPGYVITSRANLLGRPDLHIYDSPRHLEDPTPVLFVAPEAVQDDPEAGLLVPMPGQPLYFNFHLDAEQVVPAIGRMLAETLAARRPVANGSRRAPAPSGERRRRVREEVASNSG